MKLIVELAMRRGIFWRMALSPTFATGRKFCQFFGFFGPGSRIQRRIVVAQAGAFQGVVLK